MAKRSLHILESTFAALHPAQTDAIELACLDCGYVLCEESQPKNAVKELLQNPRSMLLTDVAGLVQLVQSHPKLPTKQIIVCAHSNIESETQPPEKFRDLEDIRFLIGATVPSFMRSVLGSILEFQLTKDRGVRGLAPRLLRVEELKWKRFKLVTSEERETLGQKVTQFFTKSLAEHKEEFANGISSYPKNLADVLDEFLMNAIWDANPERMSDSRRTHANLNEGESIEIFYAFDGLNLILSVEDSHGTFPVKAMGGPLRYALGFKDEAKIKEGPGGAGLGLYMVLQKVAALSIEVERGKKTRAVAILRADLSLREMQKKARTVLLFES